MLFTETDGLMCSYNIIKDKISRNFKKFENHFFKQLDIVLKFPINSSKYDIFIFKIILIPFNIIKTTNQS